MASLLEDYPNASTKRNYKFERAVASVLAQSFEDWELIICSDGCDKTDYVLRKFIEKNEEYRNQNKESYEKYLKVKNIKHCRVERNGLFKNSARNKGIEISEGEYIIYLDSDDIWGKDHLKIFAKNLNGEDWVWANDWIYYDEKWHERSCDMEQYAHCGTSNICHAKRLGVQWGTEGYGHDYHLIQKLLLFKNYKQIPTAQYYVCHIGGAYEI